MARLIEHERAKLAYSAARRGREWSLMYETNMPDAWQVLNTSIIEHANESDINVFCAAIRRDVRRALRDYGWRRVHVRSSDGIVDRTSNERAWVREEKWLASNPLPPGNRTSSEQRRLSRMRIDPERRRAIARLGGLRKKENI